MAGVLDGVRVIDFSSGQAGAMAGLLLAQSGADVLRVRRDGDPVLLTDVQDALWNRGKRRETLASDPDASNAGLEAILADADILVHDRLPSAQSALGIDAASLSARLPRLIHVAIGGWPAGHPNEETPVRDALVLAQMGLFDEQEAIGREGPTYLRFPLGSNLAAYLAVVGALARLHARRRTGTGGPVRTSLAQGAMLPTMMHWWRAERPSRAMALGFPKNVGATLFACSDDLWIHTMGDPLKSTLVREGLEALSPETRAAANRRHAHKKLQYHPEWGALEEVFRTRPRDTWLDALWSSDVPVQPVLKMGDLYTDEQALANHYVLDVEDPTFGRTRQPGPPMEIAPNAGPLATPEVAHAALSRPLDGLRVLDCGNFLAGPLAGMLLGDLGADVVKLEAVTGDPMRASGWAFNGCQRSKRDIAVQLKDRAARPLLQRLFAWADVVHHNQRLPAAERLGLGWADVHAANPAAVYCHVSSYGPAGPRKDWPGFDQLFQASAGWEYEGAGQDNRPMWHRFGMMDHLCALASTVATLLALLRRDSTGEGEFVAASLLGASLVSVETLVLPDGSLAPYARLDHRQYGVGPMRRLYRTAQGWIVVWADDEQACLARAGADPDGLEGRVEAMSSPAAVALFEGFGAFATPVVLDNLDGFLDDPDNRRTGLAVEFQHPEYGRFEHLGAAWDFGDLSLDITRPPPLLGQHTLEILAEQGFAPGEIDALVEGGTVKAA